ncbi:copper amine oxidase [bacterium]|nr:copper amine oxidase [bacterium]
MTTSLLACLLTVSPAGVGPTSVTIDPSKFQPQIVVGKGRVGSLDTFANMIKRSKAEFAINGAFFDAYSNRPIRNTVQTLIRDGELINMSDIGSVIGFSESGQARIGRLKPRIRGKVGTQSWYAYRINNDPSLTSNLAMEFNRFWGTETGFDGGIQVQVKNGTVTKINRVSTSIPPDGYVLFFKGTEESLGKRFSVGARVTREVNLDGSPTTFWKKAVTAVGAGPTLVRGGKVVVNAQSEGFNDPKILTGSGARSMIGVKANGHIVLAISSGTMSQIAKEMVNLGCVDAMNLDGGASSGLYASGKYLRTAGRELTNSLVFVPR